MSSVFDRLSVRLREAIVARLGWTSLRPVQELAGEALLAGENAIILAPTAGGKTEAAMFPALSMLLEEEPRGVGVLYIAPIKALLNNQAERLGEYTEMVGLRRFVWHGDSNESGKRRFIKEPAEVLMTTPESLEVMLISGRMDERALFGELRMVVVDEVHALAGSDRGAHLLSVLERIVRCSRHDVQRVGLSATVGNPETIASWLQGSSQRAARVVEPPRVPTRRQVVIKHCEDLEHIATRASQFARGKKSLFFCQSRAMAEAVADKLREGGTEVFVHHSAVSRAERELAEASFHVGNDACIVCTSTLELGIDVGDLDRVLQAEAPDTVSSFLQRMGRTGRRPGQAANTTFLCETSQGVVQALALVSLAREGWVEHVEVNRRNWAVLLHQLLAMSLAGSGISAEDAWTHLSQIYDFKSIFRAEYDRLIAWLVEDGGMRLASGLLVLGPKAEKRFRRNNFMELFSVFTTPQAYTVQTMRGQELGSLSQGFVDRLVEDVSCFLLGGRAWAVMRVQHSDRRIFVEPASGGRQPTWGGFLPQFLGQEVCQRMGEVLASTEVASDLDERAREALAAERERLADVLTTRWGGIEVDEEGLRWWTFAGGRINATLRYALESFGYGWSVVPDNVSLRVEGETLSQGAWHEALERLGGDELWEDEALWDRVAQSLPQYRMSKFQPLMPPWMERELVASHMLDVGGAWQWLSGVSSEAALLNPALPDEPTHAAPRDETAADVASEGVEVIVENAVEERAPCELAPEELPPLDREAGRALHWVRSDAELEAAVLALVDEAVIGLDVETTLTDRSLCLMQIATSQHTYIIDPLLLSDLSPLERIFSDANILKVIHYASFEKSVLGRYGLSIAPIYDTWRVSRERRIGHKGHSLKAVCARELGRCIGKEEQTSDWSKRPLTESQVAYAALDAEVLLTLHALWS